MVESSNLGPWGAKSSARPDQLLMLLCEDCLNLQICPATQDWIKIPLTSGPWPKSELGSDTATFLGLGGEFQEETSFDFAEGLCTELTECVVL